MSEMTMWKKAISGGVLFATYVLLIFSSCVFYALILYSKTKIYNKIAPELGDETASEVKPRSARGNVSPAKEEQDFVLFHISNHDPCVQVYKLKDISDTAGGTSSFSRSHSLNKVKSYFKQ